VLLVESGHPRLNWPASQLGAQAFPKMDLSRAGGPGMATRESTPRLLDNRLIENRMGALNGNSMDGETLGRAPVDDRPELGLQRPEEPGRTCKTVFTRQEPDDVGTGEPSPPAFVLPAKMLGG